jgi:SAM-dependent methyltransferase
VASIHEPGIGPPWASRANLPGLASVLDPADLLGAKNGLIDRVHRAALRRALGDVRQLNVLDFGCGTGRLTDWLAAQGANVDGVDPVPEMVASAKQRYPSRRFSVSELPLAAAERNYDIVLTTLVLQYPVVDRASFGPLVAEIARVLRPGGRLVSLEQVHEGDLPWGAPAAVYESAFREAGLEVVERRQVRWGSSRIVRMVERRPRIGQLPLVTRLVGLEARRAPTHPAGQDYVDTLFQARRPFRGSQ